VTLGFTAKAANAAKTAADAAVNAQRPWLKILSIEVSDGLCDDGNGFRIGLKVVVKNIGNSPATNVKTWAPMACGGNGVPFVSARGKLPSIGPNEGRSLFPGENLEEEVFGRIVPSEVKLAAENSQKSNSIHIGVVVCCRYRFAGGIGETNRLYNVVFNGSFLDYIDIHKLPIAKENISLQVLAVEDSAS
jgi:hypothetical protein